MGIVRMKLGNASRHWFAIAGATSLSASLFLGTDRVLAQDGTQSKIVVELSADGKSLTVSAPMTTPYPKSGPLTVRGIDKLAVDAKQLSLKIKDDKGKEEVVTISDCTLAGVALNCKYTMPEGKCDKCDLIASSGGATSPPTSIAYDSATAKPPKGDDEPNSDPSKTGGKFGASEFSCAVSDIDRCAYDHALEFVHERMGYEQERKACEADVNKSCKQLNCDYSTRTDLIDECSWKKRWQSRTPQAIYEQHPFAPDIAIVFYDDQGNARYSLDRLDEDDRLFVVIVANAHKKLDDLRVAACGARAALNVGGSFGDRRVGGYGTDEKEGQPDPKSARVYILEATHGCSSDTGFKAIFSAGGQAKEISLETLTLNRVTLGLGVVYDFSLQTQYRAATVAGENVPVIVQDEQVRGLVPLVPFVSLRPFAVDLKRTRTWYESVSLNVGFSFTDPLNHLLVGLLVDPIPGLGFTAGWHFRREPVLGGGYRVGDRIAGGEVSTDMRWTDPKPRDVFVGLNFDAGVLTRILGGVFK